MEELDPKDVVRWNVFNILVQECGARRDMWDEFRTHWPDCREFRFQGELGFGGKICFDGGYPWVSCYQEDMNNHRHRMIDRANQRLESVAFFRKARKRPA